MTMKTSSRLLMAGASAMAFASGVTIAPAYADSYMAGDIHNHTTCNDGNYSVQTMVTAALSTYGLDWLGDSGHGGSFTRDCRYDDPEGDSSKTGTGALFESTIGIGAFKGDAITSTSNSPDGNPHRAMWEWQIIQDYHYPEDARMAKLLGNSMLFIGTEHVVPGHEHSDTTVIFGQKLWAKGKNVGNAFAAAEYEYRFDRGDTDFSKGAPDHNWTGKVGNATGAGSGILNHNNKAVPGVQWEQTNYPLTSYFLPTHVERAGVFNPDGNNGYNIEHFRDFNNAGPTVAFGFETEPGHQAANSRGEYAANFCGAGCDSVGVTTFGGVGIYGAKIGGLWDAMLGEGRNFFFFASSDFHQRGMYNSNTPNHMTTADFFPGEYQKLYILKPKSGPLRPQVAVDGLRTGNSFSVMGDLINGDFTMEAKVLGLRSKPKHMGETLVVPAGRDVEITLTVNDPTTLNNSPYTFDNPSLLQNGIHQPLNSPVLDHIDFIGGNVTGVVAPNDPNYTVPSNPSAHILATYGSGTWTANGTARSVTFIVHNVQNGQYVRVRGTNLPPATPNETDASGNPLGDGPKAASVIPCLDAGCPAHLPVINGVKMTSNDVAAWADLWFYGNPIFLRLQGEDEFLVEKNADLAKQLAKAK